MITLTPGYHKPTEGKLIISSRKKREFEETYITTGIENVGREESEVISYQYELYYVMFSLDISRNRTGRYSPLTD